MAHGRFVAYYRVSTQKQGRSGLGLAAQRVSVAEHLCSERGDLLAEFTEVESGKRAGRVELAKALAACKTHKAALLVAKMDRLSRNVAFIANLIEAKVEFVACDFPSANKLTLHILAAVAEHEHGMISQRTTEALRAAKARGVVLGATGPRNLQGAIDRLEAEANAFADKMRDTILGLKARALSQRAIARELNELGVKAPRGGRWHLITVHRVLARLVTKRAGQLDRDTSVKSIVTY